MIELLFVLLSVWNPYIERYAVEYDVPPDVIQAILWVESYGDPYAVGYSGEKGLMQVIPGTAEYIANCTNMTADAILNDPITNIRAGSWYFARWYHRFGDIDLALSSYNGGPKYVITHHAVNPYTQHYVDKVNGILATLSPTPSVICIGNDPRCLMEDY